MNIENTSMKKYIMYLYKRLKEPSTHAGIAALLLVIFSDFSEEQVEVMIGVIAAVFAFLAISLPDTFNSKEVLKEETVVSEKEETLVGEKDETNT